MKQMTLGTSLLLTTILVLANPPASPIPGVFGAYCFEIVEVAPGGPAEAANLAPGDLICEVDWGAINEPGSFVVDPETFAHYLAHHSPITLSLLRHGQAYETEITPVNGKIGLDFLSIFLVLDPGKGRGAALGLETGDRILRIMDLYPHAAAPIPANSPKKIRVQVARAVDGRSTVLTLAED